MLLANSDESEATHDHHGVKKRKLNSVNGGVDVAPPLNKRFKKKKTLKATSTAGFKEDDPRFLQYETTKNYAMVYANPELLPKTPKIFKLMQQNKKLDTSPNSFILDLMTIDCFNTDLNERFTNINISSGDDASKGSRRETNSHSEGFASSKKAIRQENRSNFRERKKDRQGKRQEGGDGRKSFDPEGVLSSSEGDERTPGCNVDTYNMLQKKGLIFHMHHPSIFSFHGEIKITLIKGEIEILGYCLNENSDKKSVNVYSPNFCTSLTVESKSPRECKTEEEVQSILENILTEKDLHTLLTRLKSEDSILLVEQIVSSFGIVINNYFDKPLFPKDLEDVSSLSETVKSLQSIFNFAKSKETKQFTKNPEWDKILLGQCTVLCGGKGVGKSTLLKYYINKIVAQGEKVLCLDLDPGQPEFTIPGSLSAVILSEPLLGPNFTHVTQPELLVYFGGVDVSQNPTKYLEHVNYVLEYCKRNEELLKMKWFVNTMGFCKGLGVDLMITILKLLKPDLVIQIKSFDFKNNYPFYMTPKTLNSQKGFRSMPVNDVYLSFDLRVINTRASRSKKSSQGGLTPRQLRDIMSISYFSGMTSAPFYNFNAVQPYLISFSKLYLGIDSLIAPNDILKAFNGNIVSLSHFEPDCEEIYTSETEGNEYFKIVVKPSIMPSLGIGFVRGIDCLEKKFYVMTHLSAEDLEKVNCLSLGKIGPPHSMFLKQDQIEGQAVYTSLSTVDVVQKVKRIFRVPEHLKQSV